MRRAPPAHSPPAVPPTHTRPPPALPPPPAPPPRSNATVIGASANIVSVTLLEKSGHNLSFVTWCKAGVPVTVLTVAVANLYMLRYAF
jgi:hypothetical protein